MTEPEHAVQFSVTWDAAPHRRVTSFPLRRDMYLNPPDAARIVKMVFRKGTFEITYADGCKYSTTTPMGRLH